MISIRNIQTVARYERKILFRSWFFRIFAILALVIIGFFHGAMLFQHSPFSWNMKAIPSATLYNSMAMLNIVQSIIAIFLAADFMKRDKKLDTAEVLFIRPMSNSDYVLGKTWGIVSLFFYLNLVVMVLAAILMLSSGEIPFRIMPFFYYFFLLSIPSLVFILGLAFFLMGVLKNQAITFLILLAYIATNLFYLADKAFYMFDYLAFKRPFLYSDIIGFASFSGLVFHRLFYLFLGAASIFGTILMLKRIEQSRIAPYIASTATIASLIAAVFCGYLYLSPLVTTKQDRKAMVKLSSEYFEQPTPSIESHKISLVHNKTLSMESEMSLRNGTKKDVSEAIFTLNPGLTITSATTDSDEQLNVIREKHIVKVQFSTALSPDRKIKINLKYGGNITQSVCYLDANFETFFDKSNFISVWNDHHYAIQKPDYLLLTKECLWYPVAGVGYDPKRPAVFKQHFTKFTLEVTTDSSLMAISQGKSELVSPGTYRFKPRDPLPQLSLVVGKYEKRNIEVDGLNISLAYIKGHNYFDEYLKDTKDTIKSVILDFLDNFERPLSMYYPYKEFTMVEVPAQFKAIQHSWTSALDNSQPQMVLIPERGFDLRQADLKSSLYYSKRDNDRNNSGKTDTELQSDMFKAFLQNVLGNQNSEFQFGQMNQGTKPNPYCIYPNYFYFVNFISSDEFPIINYAFESYLRKAEEDPRQMFMMRAMGIGDSEKANIMLDGKSLKNIIATNTDPVALNRVLSVKGAYLLSWIEKQINNQDFDEFLLKFLYDNSYREISYTEFSQLMKERFGVNLDGFLNDWYSGEEIPAYKVQSLDLFQTIDQNQVVYVANAKVTNYSNVSGLVKFSFRSGGGGGRGGFNPFGGGGMTMETDDRIFLIGANETREIQMVLTDQPRGVTFNSLISKNLPATETFFRRQTEENNTIKPIEFDRVIEYADIKNSSEIIVDNEDNGFKIIDPAADNPIKKLFKKEKEEKEYVGMGFGQTPGTWSLTASSDFYGEFIHSAMFVKSGTGTKKAMWQSTNKNPGYYSVYSYNQRERGRRGPGGGPGDGGGQGGERGERSDPVGSYFYTIFHDDGVEEIELKTKDISDGWNFLGSFYFSSDSVKVELSDKGGASRVIADAVKWVKESK
jgi:ABC-type transport system involved in multi-copper enzyme maturation permease subunit